MNRLLMLARPVVIVFIAMLVSTARLSTQAPLSVRQAVVGETGHTTPEVSTADLERILADQSATVLDARPYREFAMSHIPGAVNVAPKTGVPMSMYVSDVAEIGRLLDGRKTAPVVLYCNGPQCGKSNRLAAELVEAGYTNVRRYQLGIPIWRAVVGSLPDRNRGGATHHRQRPDGGHRRRARGSRVQGRKSAWSHQYSTQSRHRPQRHRRDQAGQGRRPAADGGPQHSADHRRPGCGNGAVRGRRRGSRGISERHVFRRLGRPIAGGPEEIVAERLRATSCTSPPSPPCRALCLP